MLYFLGINYHVKIFWADSEFHMIEILRQNKVHVVPIFEPTKPASDDEANNVNLYYLGRSAEVLFIVCGDPELF